MSQPTEYQVVLERRAEKGLKRIPPDVLRRIDAKLVALARNPRPPDAVKLTTARGEGYRVRVGKYRVLYTVDDKAKVVTVYRIRLREVAYRE